ncbi:MAG: endonuclease domain-containing protein [Clostridiales Family XIII bacterium]|jgi:hypothetical protein|nr:endonuclease domain-containing protein [Clostridiales Family XIII bacterium]
MKIVYSKTNPYDPRQFEQIGPHLFVPQAEWTIASEQERHRAIVKFYAERLKNPNVIFSGISGAVMRGIPVLGEIPLGPRCCLNIKQGGIQEMVKWRYTGKLPAYNLIDGVRVACVERVLVDLCLEFDSASCLVALNHSLYTRQTTVRKLQGYVEKHACLPGVRRLARLLPFANAKCESPLETQGWRAVYQGSLTLPCQQVEIRLPQDCRTRVARVDMCWSLRSGLLVVELDGRVKYQTQDALVNEKIREDGLRRLGCRVLRFLWEDVRSGKMVAQLRDAGVKKRRNMGRKIPGW